MFRNRSAESAAGRRATQLERSERKTGEDIDDIDLVDMGSALGVHAGPGAFGVGCQKVTNG